MTTATSYFLRYIATRWASKGDILLGISTSGNSRNSIRAAQSAKKKGMKVIILSGKDGGKLANSGRCLN